MPRLVPPKEIKEICRTLEAAGHEAWCVGGAVRDALLGIETLDWDIATSARPEQVQQLFRRTVPVGLKFGTVGVLDRAGVLHEVTTFRHDVETDGRHAVVRFGATLDEDLARRDFTFNAIAVHAERLEVRDPFHGREDLERGVVRCVGDARERMREDRLRALRAIRFAGRFGFTIAPDTWEAIRESAPHLGRLSMERVKQELEKVMEQVVHPSATLDRYREAGVFATLVPSLAAAPRERFLAVDRLALPGLKGRPGRRALRLAALFVQPGAAPGRELERSLKALKYSNVEARETVALSQAAAAHPLPLDLALDGAPLRRAVARVGRLELPALARLLWAHGTVAAVRPVAGAAGATAGGTAGATAGAGGLAAGGNDGRGEPHEERARRATRVAAIGLYRRAMRVAWRDPLTLGDLAVDGDDLRAAGVPAGRAIGETLARLMEQVIEDPALNARDRLLALAAGRE